MTVRELMNILELIEDKSLTIVVNSVSGNMGINQEIIGVDLYRTYFSDTELTDKPGIVIE